MTLPPTFFLISARNQRGKKKDLICQAKITKITYQSLFFFLLKPINHPTCSHLRASNTAILVHAVASYPDTQCCVWPTTPPRPPTLLDCDCSDHLILIRCVVCMGGSLKLGAFHSNIRVPSATGWDTEGRAKMMVFDALGIKPGWIFSLSLRFNLWPFRGT